MDLLKLMQRLREHVRGLSGERKQAGRPPQRASVEETCKALTKRLKASGVREGVRKA